MPGTFKAAASAAKLSKKAHLKYRTITTRVETTATPTHPKTEAAPAFPAMIETTNSTNKTKMLYMLCRRGPSA